MVNAPLPKGLCYRFLTHSAITGSHPQRPPIARLDDTRLSTDNRRMATPTIALARRHDAALLAAMSRRLVEAGLQPQWTESRIERARQHADHVVLTARLGGSLAGFAIMQYGDDAAHLNLLAVESIYQRQGIGRQLLHWLEETACTAGTFRIRLEVRANNTSGQAFYKALGYQQTDWVRGYYQDHEDALRLERDLALIRSAGTT